LSANPLNINPNFSRKSGLYRYSFNGKESDREVSDLGEGTQDYGFRIYNPSLGKFLSVDPIAHKFAFYTPYQFAGNKPIVAIDLDGLEDVWTHTFKEADGSLYTTTMASTDEGFEDFKNNLIATMNIPLSEIPASGEFVSICETDLEGNKNCSWVNGLPTVVVSDASLGESFGTRFTNALMAITGGLNELGSPEYGYEYDGVYGMYGAADAVDELGDKLSYIPTPPTRIFGKIFQLEADAMRTIADSQTMVNDDFEDNLKVRAGSGLVDEVMGKVLERDNNPVRRYFLEQFTRKTIDKVKDANTKKP
jgi:RHS repeat-associated protein